MSLSESSPPLPLSRVFFGVSLVLLLAGMAFTIMNANNAPPEPSSSSISTASPDNATPEPAASPATDAASPDAKVSPVADAAPGTAASPANTDASPADSAAATKGAP